MGSSPVRRTRPTCRCRSSSPRTRRGPCGTSSCGVPTRSTAPWPTSCPSPSRSGPRPVRHGNSTSSRGPSPSEGRSPSTRSSATGWKRWRASWPEIRRRGVPVGGAGSRPTNRRDERGPSLQAVPDRLSGGPPGSMAPAGTLAARVSLPGCAEPVGPLPPPAAADWQRLACGVGREQAEASLCYVRHTQPCASTTVPGLGQATGLLPAS